MAMRVAPLLSSLMLCGVVAAGCGEETTGGAVAVPAPRNHPPTQAQKPTGPPKASHAFLPFATTRGGVVSDGERTVAYIGPNGLTNVLDNDGSLVRTLPTPEPGRTYNVSLEAVGSGQLLWAAYHKAPPATAIAEVARVWIGSTTTGHIAQLDTGPWKKRFVDAYPRAIGAQWVEADTNGSKVSNGAHLTYLNWHSGDVLTNTRDQSENVATVTPDLDRPDLWTPLCPPLRRPPDNMAENEDFEPFLQYQYRPPFGLPVRQSIFSLQLYRCGHARPRILSRCRGNCWGPRLSSRIVVWVEGRQVRIYRLAARCTARVRLPGKPFLERQTVVFSRSRLFVSRGPERSRTQRLYTARLPNCRKRYNM